MKFCQLGQAERPFPLMDVLAEYFSHYDAGDLTHKWEKSAYQPNKLRFSISGTGSCSRQRVLMRTGAERKPKSLHSRLTLFHGDAIEGLWSAALIAAAPHRGYEVFTQQKMDYETMDEAGTLDAYVAWPDDYGIVIDCKSASKIAFARAVREGGKMDNKMQLMGYMLSQEAEGRPVRHGELHYIGKEYGEVAQVLVDINDQELRTAVLDKWQTDLNHWLQYLDSDTLPDELPFTKVYSPKHKHVVSGRVKVGDPIPDWHCSPLYCDVLNSCPGVRAWWNGNGTSTEEAT